MNTKLKNLTFTCGTTKVDLSDYFNGELEDELYGNDTSDLKVEMDFLKAAKKYQEYLEKDEIEDPGKIYDEYEKAKAKYDASVIETFLIDTFYEDEN